MDIARENKIKNNVEMLGSSDMWNSVITLLAVFFTVLFLTIMFMQNLTDAYRRLKKKPTIQVHASVDDSLINDQYKQRQEVISRIRNKLSQSDESNIAAFLESGFNIVNENTKQKD